MQTVFCFVFFKSSSSIQAHFSPRIFSNYSLLEFLFQDKVLDLTLFRIKKQAMISMIWMPIHTREIPILITGEFVKLFPSAKLGEVDLLHLEAIYMDSGDRVNLPSP